jgi:hypothetical protein
MGRRLLDEQRQPDLGWYGAFFSFASFRVPIVRQLCRSGIRPSILAQPLQQTQGTSGSERGDDGG